MSRGGRLQDRSRDRGRDLPRGLLEERSDLVVRGRPEVGVELPHGREPARGLQTHELVGLSAKAHAPSRAGTRARPAPPVRRRAPAPHGTPPARSTRSRCRRRPPAPSGRRAPAAAGPPGTAAPAARTSARSRCSTSANSTSLMCRRLLTRSFTTSAPSSPTAPIASSGWNGTPSLRTTITSNGASSARATSAATGTPPRGSPSTTTSSPRRWRSRSPSRRPASTRSLNGTTTPSTSRQASVRRASSRPSGAFGPGSTPRSGTSASTAWRSAPTTVGRWAPVTYRRLAHRRRTFVPRRPGASMNTDIVPAVPSVVPPR